MVPEGWEKRSLGEFVSEVVRRDGNGLPVLSVSKDLGIVLQREKFGRIIASDDRSRYKRVRRGEFAYDPMLLWDGSIAQQTRVDEGVVSPAYYVFELHPSTVDRRFVEQFLTADRMKGHYRAISEGTNQRRRKARFEDFAGLEFPLPPLPEQRKIAAILCSVGDAITATRRVIDQTKRVKQGLLQTLMTRGIGHARFKTTEIGEVPEEWEIVPFASLVSDRIIGTAERGEGADGDYRLIKMGNLTWGGLDLSVVEAVERTSDLRRLELRPGDLLFNTRNTPELVGKTAVWDGPPGTAIPDNNIMRVRLEDRVMPAFLCGQMAHGRGRGRLRRLAAGSTSVAAIYWKDLAGYQVGLPPIDEQRRIVQLLNGTDEQIAASEAVLASALQLKTGLMQDLLTGRVRVQPA